MLAFRHCGLKITYYTTVPYTVLCCKVHRSPLVEDGSKVLFVGDSLSDIEALNVATWAATTANAPIQVKEFCDYASEYDGGSGGFADILIAVHEDILNHPSKDTNKFSN